MLAKLLRGSLKGLQLPLNPGDNICYEDGKACFMLACPLEGEYIPRMNEPMTAEQRAGWNRFFDRSKAEQLARIARRNAENPDWWKTWRK